MWCYYFHLERDCQGICGNCPYGYNPFPSVQIQFNYECPSCHGKFNQPSVPLVAASLYYRCPHCGRHMSGL